MLFAPYYRVSRKKDDVNRKDDEDASKFHQNTA